MKDNEGKRNAAWKKTGSMEEESPDAAVSKGAPVVGCALPTTIKKMKKLPLLLLLPLILTACASKGFYRALAEGLVEGGNAPLDRKIDKQKVEYETALLQLQAGRRRCERILNNPQLSAEKRRKVEEIMWQLDLLEPKIIGKLRELELLEQRRERR